MIDTDIESISKDELVHKVRYYLRNRKRGFSMENGNLDEAINKIYRRHESIHAYIPDHIFEENATDVFIGQLYYIIHGRYPSAEEINGFLKERIENNIGNEEFIERIVHSAEALNSEFCGKESFIPAYQAYKKKKSFYQKFISDREIEIYKNADEINFRELFQWQGIKFLCMAFLFFLNRKPTLEELNRDISNIINGSITRESFVMSLLGHETAIRNKKKLRNEKYIRMIWKMIIMMQRVPLLGKAISLYRTIRQANKTGIWYVDYVYLRSLMDEINMYECYISKVIEMIKKIHGSSHELALSIRENFQLRDVNNQNIQTEIQNIQTEMQNIQTEMQKNEGGLSDLKRVLENTDGKWEAVFKEKVYNKLEGIKMDLYNMANVLEYVKRENIDNTRRIRKIMQRKDMFPDDIRTEEGKSHGNGNESTDYDNIYVLFEDKFRGSREEIKRKLHVYLKYLTDSDAKEIRVIDIGCGRGEWIELLKEELQIDAMGVDINQKMIEFCRQLNLTAEYADGEKYLGQIDDETIHCISMFQVAEHLEFEKLMNIMDLAYSKLARGGLLIVETPNPENISVGGSTFYVDMSHKNPIHPDALQFFVEMIGFKEWTIERVNPVEKMHWIKEDEINDVNIKIMAKNMNSYFMKSRDYAVVAWK